VGNIVGVGVGLGVGIGVGLSVGPGGRGPETLRISTDRTT